MGYDTVVEVSALGNKYSSPRFSAGSLSAVSVTWGQPWSRSK